jgi:hypothetical protein
MSKRDTDSAPELGVELCDANSITRMLSPRNRVRPIRGLKGDRGVPRQALAPRARRCACGTCKFCTENERWNRIFREKFADPNYYRGPIVRHSSSLSSFWT